MLTRSVLVFVVFLACSIRQSESWPNFLTSWFNQVRYGDGQIKCKFLSEDSEYSCELQNSFTRRDTKILHVSGSHVGGQTNKDVDWFISSKDSKLKFLPIAMGRFFPNLEVYDVQHSGVKEISRKNFADLPKLKLLEISHSQLKVIPVDALYDLANLEQLRMPGNQIKAIDSSTFIHNAKLGWIDMSSNKITSLDAKMFSSNLELISINFGGNLITSIGPELLTPLGKLKQVDFRNNTCADKEWGKYKYEAILTPSEKEEIKEMFASKCQ